MLSTHVLSERQMLYFLETVCIELLRLVEQQPYYFVQAAASEVVEHVPQTHNSSPCVRVLWGRPAAQDLLPSAASTPQQSNSHLL
jgi:hypothetical protein